MNAVWIVDDDRSIRWVLEKALTREEIPYKSFGAAAEVLAALEAGDPVATHAARAYTRILGQTLADLALIHLSYGGIYLIGGMARAMTPFFARFGLRETFREDRRVDLLVRDFSVSVVEDDYAALTGCAAWLEAQG